MATTNHNNDLTRPGTPSENYREQPSQTPLCDIFENSDELLLLADVPGVSRDKLTIRLEKEHLTLEAQQEETSPGFGGPRRYFREFVVPNGIDAEKISADLKHGVLTVRLPKSAKVKPRLIEVKVN